MRDLGSNQPTRQFVMAQLKGVCDVRQGVLVEEREDSVLVQGLLGLYVCEKDYTVVPTENLWWNDRVREFARVMGVV